MRTNISGLLSAAGTVTMGVSVFALIMAIVFQESRRERKVIFMQALICSLLLWYISWLIG